MPSIHAVEFTLGEPHVADPRHLHAVVSGWLDNDDSHRDGEKPWAVGPQRITDTGLAVMVRLLDDTLLPRLLTAVGHEQEVYLGNRGFSLRGTVGAVKEVFAVDWDALENPAVVPRWRFHLQAPVVFNDRRLGYHVTVDALSVLRTLERRWSRWNPRRERLQVPPGVFTATTRTRVVVQPYDLPTMPRRGLIGEIDLAMDPADRADTTSGAETLSVLAQWAQFAGLGAKTTHGFGATAVRPVLG